MLIFSFRRAMVGMVGKLIISLGVSKAGLGVKLKPRKFASLMIILTFFIALLGVVSPGTANAVCGGNQGVPADTLTIKVGYFGGPYYTKKIYTLSDFDKLSQVEQTYTFIDSISAVCIDRAKGVKLTDIIEDAGVDINSVQKFYFYSTDIKNGWYQCLDKSFLLDTPRYYYPNLPSYWDYETNTSLPEAVYGAVLVDPIIAYQDNWRRYEAAPDDSYYDTSTRFRLLLGQKNTTDHDAPLSVKWVHAIEIMLGGMPPVRVTLNQNLINLKVGSTFQLTATVAPDKAAEKSVTWTSSDTSAATVDENGLITVTGPGKAVITVNTVVGNMTDTCIVNDLNQKDNQAVVSAGANPSGKVPAAPVSDRQYLKDKDLADVNPVTAGVSPVQSGSQPWRVFEMSTDAVPLQQQKQCGFNIYATLVFSALFLAGAVKSRKEYIKETAVVVHSHLLLF